MGIYLPEIPLQICYISAQRGDYSPLAVILQRMRLTLKDMIEWRMPGS